MDFFVNGISFHIPCDWLRQAEISRIGPPKAEAYAWKPDDETIHAKVQLVKISVVAPLKRELDNGTMFDEVRMVSVLRGMATGQKLPPIEVNQDTSRYTYKVYDGVHRYYASAALGYSHLPVIVKAWSFEDYKAWIAEEAARGMKS